MTSAPNGPPSAQELQRQVAELQARLGEAEATLEAIRHGDVDAIVVGRDSGTQIYTLEAADRPYRVLIEQMQEGALTLNSTGHVLYCNGRLAELVGIDADRILGSSLATYVDAADGELLDRLFREALKENRRAEIRLGSDAAARRPVLVSIAPLSTDDGLILCAVVTDLSEQHRRNRELVEVNQALREQMANRERAEAQLRQAQKMEAVGQLTGGIAHDFNNLLMGISGSLEMLTRHLATGRLDIVERYVAGAQDSSRRAATLTQRLLAFSRRQTLDPHPTDVNKLIAGMDELLRRSLGPTIALEIVGAGGLWLTRIDPSQLENAILNLSINGRDAMAPAGGRLTIETANKWLDDRAGRDRDLPPGQYISVCVTDTGTGMTPDVVAQAFDPFFTTKPLGQGTGLGLSMIYGFVRQSGGQVRIYSEPGKGTTVCLYLPRHTGELENVAADPVSDAEHGAGEIVLVIDDEPIVRALIVEVLRQDGYRPIEAGDGLTGLKILQSAARIDLLITDVGLPGGMNGRQVADAARVFRPELKVLFITGYAENAVVGNGHLEAGMDLITKPFEMAALAAKVRELIDRP